MVIRVDIWGAKIEVEVHQQSKSVWIARGEYPGAIIRGEEVEPQHNRSELA